MLAGSVTPQDVTGVAGVLLNQGVIGALALVIGWVGLQGWRRERDRADAERAAKDALVREIMDKIVPALVESTRAQRDFVDLSRGERRSDRR